MIALRTVSLAGLVCVAVLCAASAQEPEPAPVIDPNLTTLHVYANLIQMPVLVLGMDRSPLPPIKPERFTITLDGGPPYKPTHVRLEGSDPISFAILLDLTGNAANLMPRIDKAIASLTPTGLTARDHVTIYALNCGLLRTLNDKSADPLTLQQGVERALAPWKARRTQRHPPPCDNTFHLWDSIGVAALHLGDLPGRRVLLAITDGEDSGSRHPWQEVLEAMQTRAITLFGVRPPPPVGYGSLTNGRGGVMRGAIPVSSSDTFTTLSELSGGMVLTVDHDNAAPQIARIPALVRGRYVLEFPRPGNSSAGDHVVEVQVGKSADFIRASGISVPLPNPAILADPTTLPNDPGKTPEIGKHKPLPVPPSD